MRKQFLFISAFLILTSEFSISQTFLQPLYGLKFPETLIINKIDATSKAVVFYMNVTNKITGGNFCADQNIYMVYPDGTRSKLISATGIPVCPEVHKFKAIGESLDFVLTFPPMKQGTKWIDLIEDCTDNCFYFYGITLDNDLNIKIDEAFAMAENEEPVKAMVSLMNIVEETDKMNIGIEGLLYASIIKLADETGNRSRASEWYRKLKTSDAPRATQYIRYLNDQGIKF